ncbi:hypothetical protein [Methanosphaerula palustris]|uniref:hypothetical protein n=1 Tax=Methanosphaerula palustris TaxID=475088 RepID=UPI000324A5FE|nr:hypothetical protein [Methanosphaerula palustris]
MTPDHSGRAGFGTWVASAFGVWRGACTVVVVVWVPVVTVEVPGTCVAVDWVTEVGAEVTAVVSDETDDGDVVPAVATDDEVTVVPTVDRFADV